jgi:hypothetical protein
LSILVCYHLQEYQSCLEEVLAWLLEADNKLKNMLPVCEADMDMVKRQFKEHEDFMLKLHESQESVGKVLRRGQALAKSGRLATDSTAVVCKQVRIILIIAFENYHLGHNCQRKVGGTATVGHDSSGASA